MCVYVLHVIVIINRRDFPEPTPCVSYSLSVNEISFPLLVTLRTRFFFFSQLLNLGIACSYGI